MTVLEAINDAINQIPAHGPARVRDLDEFMTEWVLPDDDELDIARFQLAYLKGMYDTHVRAQEGEEPNLKAVIDEE